MLYDEEVTGLAETRQVQNTLNLHCNISVYLEIAEITLKYSVDYIEHSLNYIAPLSIICNIEKNMYTLTCNVS